MLTKHRVLFNTAPGAEGNKGGGAAPDDSLTNKTPVTPPTTPPAAVSFLDSLEEELKKEASLSKFKSHNDLAKSYLHLEKQFGKNKVVVPDQYATPEDWKQFYEKVGLPDKEKYKVDFGEAKFDDDFKKSFIESAHANGMLPKQAQEIFNFWNKQVSDKYSQTANQIQENQTKAIDGLKKEWGSGYPKEMRIAQEALAEFADEAQLKYLSESGLAKDVNLIKLFNKIGKSLNEDTFDRNVVKHLGMSKEEAQTKANELMGDVKGPYWNSSHPRHKEIVDEVYRLNKIVDSTNIDNTEVAHA